MWDGKRAGSSGRRINRVIRSHSIMERNVQQGIGGRHICWLHLSAAEEKYLFELHSQFCYAATVVRKVLDASCLLVCETGPTVDWKVTSLL